MPRGFWSNLFAIGSSHQSRPVLPLAGERDVAIAAGLCVLLGWIGERYARDPEMSFTISAVGAYAVLILLIRVAAGLSAAVMGRPVLAPTLAVLMLLVAAPVLGICNAIQATRLAQDHGADLDPNYGFGVFAWVMIPLVATVLWFASRRYLWPATFLQRLLVTLVIPSAALLGAERSDTWSAFYYADATIEDDASMRASVTLDQDPEDLLAIQDDLVDSALAALAPQHPGRVDLYVVAMAGDGHEDVFRNEVELVHRVFDTRLGATGRIVRLVNHPESLATLPLATRRNLLRTLDGIGRRIDPAEDIVLVFMTSHGTEDHTWAVQLADLELTQITPDDLLEAFDRAGIRWRIAIVSACYSGGFIDPLATETSLVMTSARRDRPSFGCGADADLTFFGRAFLSEALMHEHDLVQAFERARATIARLERAEGFDPSEPQIHLGSEIAAQLARWYRESLPAFNR